ncbi:MAG: methyltransferase domain-containing protein [Candidatus Omnitrophica bacterium]|nr:methyltransferase domain-containing protein [Candidatus Omnitrophota bacterium]
MNNVTYRTAAEAVKAPVGEVELVACDKCAAVFNSAFDPDILEYDRHYDNSRDSSPAYRDYLDELASKVGKDIRKDARILEVGCGNGDFLKKLCDRTHARGFGYDRAYTGDGVQGSVIFRKEYFSPSAADSGYDVLILRHVLEHLHKPYLFLKQICRPSVLAKGAKICVEVPDLEWIVRKEAFYDITYEHCNYFCRKSLAALISSAGFRDIRISNVFGGEYILLEAVYDPTACKDAMSGRPEASGIDLGNVLKGIKRERDDFIRSAENLCVWGASGKGVLFLSALNDELLKRVKYVVDINEKKQGRFLPVSAKRIEPPAVLRKATGKIDVLVMNSVYKKEIEGALSGMGINAKAHIL